MGQAPAPGLPRPEVERDARLRHARRARRPRRSRRSSPARRSNGPSAASWASPTSAWTTNWTRSHFSPGQSLRLRPAGLESRPELPADRRGVDAPDVRPRPARSCRRSSDMQLGPGASTRTTPGRWGCRPSPTSPGTHYGARRVEASERNGWGQWHRADEKGIGMDRTVATGTGFIGQYRPAVAATSTNRSRPAPTSCCCSCTTCPTRTCSIPARP